MSPKNSAARYLYLCRLLLKLSDFCRRFIAAVKKIVAGIRNSIRSVLIVINFKVAKARVRLCPMVNAVMRINIFSQYLIG